MQEFYGPLDPECSVITEHRHFILAASSQICASDLLELSGDRYGLDLVDRYQRDYVLYFALYCDRVMVERDGRTYLLEGLIPEIKADAVRIRHRLLTGDRLPAKSIFTRRSTK